MRAIWIGRMVFVVPLLVSAFAGCLGGDEENGGDAGPTLTTSPGAAAAGPGEALNKSYTFNVQNRIPADAMKVALQWATFEFTAQLKRTQQCSVLQNEAPTPPATTGPAPAVHFESPSGTRTSLALGTVNECSPMGTTGNIGTMKRSTAAAGTGDWAVTFNGVGSGIQVQVVVLGS